MWFVRNVFAKGYGVFGIPDKQTSANRQEWLRWVARAGRSWYRAIKGAPTPSPPAAGDHRRHLMDGQDGRVSRCVVCGSLKTTTTTTTTTFTLNFVRDHVQHGVSNGRTAFFCPDQ